MADPSATNPSLTESGRADGRLDVLWICDRATEAGGIALSLYDIYPALSSVSRIEFVAPRNASFPILEALGATVHKTLPRFPSVKGYVWSLLACFGMLRIARRLKPSVIVADHTNGLWLLLFLKAIRFPFRAIHRNHGTEFLILHPRLAKLLLSGVDQTITDSRPEAEGLAAVTGGPVTSIPNCLPAHCLLPLEQIRKSPEDPHAPRLAYVGWLTEAKGIYAFIEVMREIRKEIPGAQGFAMGKVHSDHTSKEDEETLLSLMSSAGVVYKGQVPRDEIFRDVDILLVCSRRESFGLTMAEAPFFGVLPIAFDSPGSSYLLSGVEGCLIENGNTLAMKNAVIAFWPDPARREEICRRLRDRFLDQFDPKTLADDLLALSFNKA